MKNKREKIAGKHAVTIGNTIGEEKRIMNIMVDKGRIEHRLMAIPLRK